MFQGSRVALYFNPLTYVPAIPIAARASVPHEGVAVEATMLESGVISTYARRKKCL